MVSFFRSGFVSFCRKNAAVYLACAWCAGLLSGCIFGTVSASFPFSLMRTAMLRPVSIFGLLTVLYLPLLFSAFAVYISQIWLLIPICFLKAFAFSFLAAACSVQQASGGWLLRFLLLFSDCLAIPLLYWVWYRACCRSRRDALYSDLVAGFLLLPIGAMDFLYISPFLSNLLS